MSIRGDDNLPILQLLPNAVTILALCAGLTSIRYAMEGRFDLAADLVDASLDLLLVASSINDRTGIFGDFDLLGTTQL